jgi:hypothetical protein
VLRSMSGQNTPHSVSMPSDSGATSSSSTPLTSPCSGRRVHRGERWRTRRSTSKADKAKTTMITLMRTGQTAGVEFADGRRQSEEPGPKESQPVRAIAGRTRRSARADHNHIDVRESQPHDTRQSGKKFRSWDVARSRAFRAKNTNYNWKKFPFVLLIRDTSKKKIKSYPNIW